MNWEASQVPDSILCICLQCSKKCSTHYIINFLLQWCTSNCFLSFWSCHTVWNFKLLPGSRSWCLELPCRYRHGPYNCSHTEPLTPDSAAWQGGYRDKRSSVPFPKYLFLQDTLGCAFELPSVLSPSPVLTIEDTPSDQKAMDKITNRKRRYFPTFYSKYLWCGYVMQSRLYQCLQAAGHSREIALIKYTGWLLSHLVPVSSALKEDTKKRLWKLQEARMSFSHSLGYLHVGKAGISSVAVFFLPYLLHLWCQGLFLQAKSIQSV